MGLANCLDVGAVHRFGRVLPQPLQALQAFPETFPKQSSRVRDFPEIPADACNPCMCTDCHQNT
jgi:hypothetical protein